MLRQIRKFGSAGGFSLAEVLIALILTGVVTTALFGTYINQHKSYIVQDDITTIQQSARTSIDELTRQIRLAGYELPYGLDFMSAANTNPDTITITYKNGSCDTYLASAMPQPSAELKCASDVSCFQDDQWVYIFEPDSGGGEFFQITNVQQGSNHIQHNTMSLSKKYGADAILLSVVRIQFYIDHTTNPDHPNLMVKLFGQQPQVYAENISDLQFRYQLKDGSTVDVPTEASDIRQVLIAVTGRSNAPEVDKQGTSNYRSRTYSSAVSLRNLGL
jgi:hypothetical protein